MFVGQKILLHMAIYRLSIAPNIFIEVASAALLIVARPDEGSAMNPNPRILGRPYTEDKSPQTLCAGV